ncbi:MAG: phasin family protein [Gammaproteobacteria bacterium]
MQNNFFQFANEAGNANKAVLEAFEKLNKTNAQTLEKLTAQQLEAANLVFEGSAKQLQLWSDAKDYSEIWGAQSKLADEYGKRFAQCAQRTLDILGEARDAYTGLVEQNVSAASESFKRTATKRAA